MADSNIKICRVYSPPAHKIGEWILIDRLWPRGIKKESLAFDLWLKDIAPSTNLRKWFNHEPEKWPEFVRCYIEELQNQKILIESIKKISISKPVILFYAAKDSQHNHALVLQAMLISWPCLPKIL